MTQPISICPGDLLTITRGDHGAELGVRVDDVYDVAGVTRIDWTEIDANGRVPDRASHGFGTDITGDEGGTWHRWATRKPVDSNPNNPPGRSRVVVATGDGKQVVTRYARRYDATAEVHVAPAGVGLVDSGEHPGLKLTVTPDGAWTLTYELGGWGQLPPSVIASGHIDQPPAPDTAAVTHTPECGGGCGG